MADVATNRRRVTSVPGPKSFRFVRGTWPPEPEPVNKIDKIKSMQPKNFVTEDYIKNLLKKK